MRMAEDTKPPEVDPSKTEPSFKEWCLHGAHFAAMLVTDPKEFFKTIVRDFFNVKNAALIILVGGLLVGAFEIGKRHPEKPTHTDAQSRWTIDDLQQREKAANASSRAKDYRDSGDLPSSIAPFEECYVYGVPVALRHPEYRGEVAHQLGNLAHVYQKNNRTNDAIMAINAQTALDHAPTRVFDSPLEPLPPEMDAVASFYYKLCHQAVAKSRATLDPLAPQKAETKALANILADDIDRDVSSLITNREVNFGVYYFGFAQRYRGRIQKVTLELDDLGQSSSELDWWASSQGSPFDVWPPEHDFKLQDLHRIAALIRTQASKL